VSGKLRGAQRRRWLFTANTQDPIEVGLRQMDNLGVVLFGSIVWKTLQPLAGWPRLCQSSPMTRPLDFSSFLATATPPELGPGPRAGVRAQSELSAAMDGWLSESKLSAERQQLVRALLLLWHDHLDPAHELAQSIDNPDGAFVHGIMHRREPDYGNAAYWFRRVGAHHVFPELAKRVSALPESKLNSKVHQQLVTAGEWTPFAFIDACRDSAARPASDSGQHYLREVQRLETETLLNWFAQPR
jgi:hypothetical protein